MKKEVAVETVADAYLELLAARGVDYFFGNGGTDFGPIVDAYAKRMVLEQPVPKPVTIAHEITGIAMAYGYAMITGKPQVVMVHTIAGTANSVGGLISACRGHMPIFFSAGRTPITEGPELRGARNGSIHWGQESFDQGGMVREWVKWDYELHHGNDLEAVVDRALAIAQSEPKGPIYLTLPREVMSEEIESLVYSDEPRMVASESVPSPAVIQKAAQALAAAKNPIAIATTLGRDTEAVGAFVRLAEALNMGVYGAGTTMNFPTDHRLYIPGMATPVIESADAVVIAESDVPWVPSSGHDASPDATVIAVGNDPLYENYPMRSFRADITLAGLPRATLDALTEAVKKLPIDKAAFEERGKRWQAEHDKARAAAKERAEAGRNQRPLSKAWVSRCFAEIATPEMILVGELGLDQSQLESTLPGTYFTAPSAGVLGWGLGASLGAKLASRDRTVVCHIGDGSYMFGAPTAAHWIARKMDLPVLFLVWNNSKWNAVEGSTRGVFPDGWAAKNDNFVFTDLSPSIEFDKICEAAGGYAERVEDPEEVPAALQRALHAVQVEGRQALLNFIGAPR